MNPGEDIFITAFWRLSSERNYESGPIPYSKKLEYAQRIGLEDDVATVFCSILESLDLYYLDKKYQESMKPSAKNPNVTHRGIPGRN